MDTSHWINGQQNYQQSQQLWILAGCSNTYPQYSKVNDPQSAQCSPGYGTYWSGQTSNNQTSPSQQLPTNTRFSLLPNNYVHGNTNLQSTNNEAQTRNFPHQWQVSACQSTTQQDPTSTESNQRPSNTTALAAMFPVENRQYSVSNPLPLITMNCKDLQESVKTTVPQTAYKESNIASMKTSQFQWRRGPSQSATHGKKIGATTKKEEARKDQPRPPPFTTSNTQMPPSKHFRREEHNATFDSSGQLPRSQMHLQHQTSVREAPAFSNSPVDMDPPSNNTQFSTANNGQLPQTSHLVNPSHPCRNPAPSYACQKAVAVVQPLSQKNILIDGCVDRLKKHSKRVPNLLQLLIGCDKFEKINTSSSSALKAKLNAEVESPDDGMVTTSHLNVGSFSTKAMMDTTASLLNGKELEGPQSGTLDASQGKGIRESKVQEPKVDDVGRLGVVPVITWTYDKLTSLTAMLTATIQPDHSQDVVRQLMKLWDNDLKNLLSLLNTDYYKNLMADVINLCKDTQNSPILSQVGGKSWQRLKEKFTVLEHDCVYFESPYVSPWLNVNKQLDDIDKEFGFPSSLKNCESICNTEIESMETNCGIPVAIVKEMAIDSVPQMSPALDVEDVAEVEPVLQTTCSQSIVPDDALTVDPKDPLDRLEIEIMSPDQARIVFEQLKNESPMLEFKSNEMISTTKETISMEEFCCINQWMKVISGPEPSLDCCCKPRLESNKPCVILTDAVLDPTEEENIIEVSLNPMQSNPSQINDLAEQFEVSQKGYGNLPITHPSTSIDLKEEDILEDILSSINGESISTTALEESCNKVELKPACPAETQNIEQQPPKDHDDDDQATAQSDQHHITEPSDNHTEAALNTKQSNSSLPDLKSICSSHTTGRTRLSPTVEPKDDYPSSLKKRPCREHRRTKGKKVQRHEVSVTSVSQPSLKDKSNKINKEKVDYDSMPAAKKTVKLALFGSLPHRIGSVSVPSSHTLSQYCSGRLHPPPSVLTLPRCSVRHRLSEEWRKSYLPITRNTGKHKTIKDINRHSTSATRAPVEAEHMDTERLPISPEQRYRIRSVKKRRRSKSLANDLTLETPQMPNKRVTKQRSVNKEGKSKKHKDPDMPLKENSVLRFRVPRNPMDLKDGPRSRNDKRDSVLDTPNSAAKGDNGLKMVFKKSRAERARIPEKKHDLLMSSNASPQNKGAGRELKKKYKKRLAVRSFD